MLNSQRTDVKLVVAVLAMLAIGIPIVVFNAWLREQGDNESAATAAWALATAETQIGQTAAALYDLSRRGIDSCRPAQLEAMRQAAMQTGPIKEIMLIAPGGQVLCSDSGAITSRYEVLGTAATASDDIALQVVRQPDHDVRFLRVIKAGMPDRPALAALVPANVLVPPVRLPGGRSADVSVSLADGTLVSGSSADFAAAQEAQSRERATSRQYGLVVTATASGKAIIAGYDDLRRISIVVSAGIAILMLGLALLIARRQSHTPIAEIAKAILANEFHPYYQPVVDIQTGRLLGAEVLVRWRRADGSLLEPQAFISLMEASGFMPELTRSLMLRVRDELGEAVGRRPQLALAFNIAPQHFHDALILNDIGTIFGGSPIKLTQIVLELTERHEVEDLGSTRRTIAALQGLGCKVAIDDVGTGHNGLSYVLKLGVDIIKIDKIFVDAIESEGHSRAIIETLIDLAKNMRMEIIAEGVENFDQVTYLRDHGITAAQGYVFAPPLPASAFLQLLEAMDPVGAASNRTAEAGPDRKPKSAASG